MKAPPNKNQEDEAIKHGTTTNRRAHSWAAAFLGWLLPAIGYYLFFLWKNGLGTGPLDTDPGIFLIWPLMATVIGWLGINILFTLFPNWGATASIWQCLLLASGGVAAGFAVAVVLIFPFAPFVALIAINAFPNVLLVGPLSGLIFWFLQKRQPLGRAGFVFWILPVLVVLGWHYGLKAAIKADPYRVHLYASGIIDDRAKLEIMKTVKVGDTFTELNATYPTIFTKRLSSSSYRTLRGSYEISFDKKMEVVTSIEVNVPPKTRSSNH